MPTDRKRPAAALLALESSTSTGSVAVGNGEEVWAELSLSVVGAHSASLLPAADRVLEVAGLTPRDLTGVVVGAGPGSFTGLRIAAATAKGIVAARGVPLHAYSSLLVAAASVGWGAARGVCALFDARHRDVFAAAYRLGPGVEETLPPLARSLDEVVERFAGVEPPLFTGDGAWRHREELETRLGARVTPVHLAGPRAAALLWLAAVDPDGGRVADPVAWEPEYLRASGAERIAAAAARAP